MAKSQSQARVRRSSSGGRAKVAFEPRSSSDLELERSRARSATAVDRRRPAASNLARLAPPIHLHPAAPLAERVLLPGDPGRALLLAQQLLAVQKMFNHNRGLWGYTGTATDGELLTIQSTGMGGPSTAIVIAELADLGAERLMRVGTCGALDPSLHLGDVIVATAAIAFDGTSRALGAHDRVAPDPELTAALQAAQPGTAAGPVATTDLFYDGPADQEQRWIDAGALAVEMESASLFAVADQRGLQAAAALVVSDVLLPSRVRIVPERLREAERRMGALATRALGISMPLGARRSARAASPARSPLRRSGPRAPKASR